MRILLIAFLMLSGSQGAALAACGGRVGVRMGDTITSIARDCNINVERLKQVNPGLTERTLRRGTYIEVPHDPLPSPRAYGGNRGISPPPDRVIAPDFGTAQSRRPPQIHVPMPGRR